MKKFKIFLLALIFTLTGVGAGAQLLADEVEPPVIEPIKIGDEADFIAKLSRLENYSSDTTLILTQDLNFSGMDLSEVYTPSEEGVTEKIFMGTFDGAGYSINNIMLSSLSGNYGLFTYAEGATIKDLKLGGEITYQFNDSLSQIYAGALVGYGERVTISNCEIASDATIVSSEGRIVVSSKATIGGFAGSLIGASSIINCVNQADIAISSLTASEQIVKVGGIAGRVSNSQISYAISYSNIDYYAQSDKVTFYAGVVAGEAEGSAKFVNVASAGTVKKSTMLNNNALDVSGAIVARLNTEKENMNFAYYTSSSQTAFGNSEDSSNVQKINSLISSFFINSANWHPQYAEWNFDNVWIAKSLESGRGVRMELQRFQTFDFSFSNLLDSSGIVEKADFLGEFTLGDNGVHKFKYGEEVEINIEFKKDKYNYYVLSSVLHDATIISNWEAEKNSTIGEFGGYTIKFEATDLTDGVYSFAFTPITFNSIVKSENFDEGGVKYRGGSQVTETMPLNLTLESNSQTIVAEPKDIFTFAHWNLYYLEGEDWVLSQENFADNASVTVKFGPAPEQVADSTYYFQQRFMLEAVFTDADAMAVTFTFDNTILDVQFSGRSFTGEAIRVSGNATRIDMFVTVKEGYELQVDRFLEMIGRLYNSDDTSSVMPNDPTLNENEQRVYRFQINMASIKRNSSTADVSLGLFTEKERNENENDLLWLWIVLPIVGVLLIVGIVLFFVFRRYFYYKRAGADGANVSGNSGKKKAKTEKDDNKDFKDYYY